MGAYEEDPNIPPSFEVIMETATRGAESAENPRNEHGLGYILKRVKDGLTGAAKNLVGGQDTAASVRDYLPTDHEDHRFVMEYVKSVEEKFADNPTLGRNGWDERMLPNAVTGQGNRVSRAQANFLMAILEHRSSQRLGNDDQGGEVAS